METEHLKNIFIRVINKDLAKKYIPKINKNEYLEMQRMNISDSLGHNTESYVLSKKR